MISLTSPVRTRAHDWPAGAKLAALSLATLGLFFVDRLGVHVVILAAVLVLYALPGGTFFRNGLAKLWMLWPFVLIVAVYHLVDGSFATGAVIVLRLVSAVALANLVTMTTRLSDMIAVLHWLTAPARKFGLDTRALEIAIALVIRMTPVMLGKGQALAQAWRARSPKRPNWRIVLPFTLLALDDADHISDALRARGGLVSQED